MEILLSVPPRFAGYIRQHKKEFPSITDVFSDPPGCKLGSGGGAVNVLWKGGFVPLQSAPAAGESETGAITVNDPEADQRPSEKVATKRIIINSDGQSRRLPAYAPMGKSFIPFPVFKWGRGQRIDQTLFDLQIPLLRTILEKAPAGLNTLVASGDALAWTDTFTGTVPDADVVCIGLWTQPDVATRHGVFVCSRHDPTLLDYMLQKPSIDTLQKLTGDHLYLLDAGIWILSDKAVGCLFGKTGWDHEQKGFPGGGPRYYDLYSEFGSILGSNPANRTNPDQPPLPALTCRIIPLEKAGFYHFGSNADLLSGTAALHDRIMDQREIWHKKIKPGRELFVENAVTGIAFNERQSSIWIENSHIPSGWNLSDHHILTGIPRNDWRIDLPSGVCLDMVPVGAKQWAIRLYWFHDTFRHTPGMAVDPYEEPVYPLIDAGELHEGLISRLIRRFVSQHGTDTTSGKTEMFTNTTHKTRKNTSPKLLSAHDISGQINLQRLLNQRRDFLRDSLTALAGNHRHSIFYQLDLKELAATFTALKISLPAIPEEPVDIMTRIHDLMFRAAYYINRKEGVARTYEEQAFKYLREGMLGQPGPLRVTPEMNLKQDQILWARSPLRLDLAGGWTDTPPYCILYGGTVINMAVELNGQQPIQVYIRPSARHEIVIHSIDQGYREVISDYRGLADVSQVGSAFAIPRAALMLSGFHPSYSNKLYRSLKEQLRDMGGGLDISLMVAVPKGSGLGTSSILAATLLGALSECCSLNWDLQEISHRTLLLEQLLTTGGGWQDQLGGIHEGIKLIESFPGLLQRPSPRWASTHLFSQPEYRSQVLLYYTGITRHAKGILKEIVRGMFLNSSSHLAILNEMKYHARATYDTLQRHDWQSLKASISHTFDLNCKLDEGTAPPEIKSILNKIDGYTDACKLLGAGGGGYLMIFAKDAEAARSIRKILTTQPPNLQARFVDWSLSATGLEITRS